MNKKVRSKDIVICRSDKDGKLIILNFDDYNSIMVRELKIFQKLDKLNQDNITNHFKDIRKKVNDYIINLHKLKCIDNNILKHTVGIKYKNGIYSKINGTIAKNFHCTEPAYAYPLFKTHKLDKSEIVNAKIYDIPIRLVQSAGRITTSRVTSFLEMLFKPISINFCKYKINEYCKDSKSYLEELNTWKNKLTQNNFNNNDIFLVAADVQGLYPNISRNLIKISMSNAIEKCTNYTKQVSKILIDLTMFCLESVVVQNETSFYTQTNGVVTGDNNSVSIANIALHHVILEIETTLKTSILFKRYIDDIIFLSQTRAITDNIKNEIKTVFEKHDLKLIFREISSQSKNKELEFLDVNHIINETEKGGFYVKNYIKPTAINRIYINGRSYHPRSIYKSIVFGESIRLRRLCERDCDYLEALNLLKERCIKSHFCKSLVVEMLEVTKKWKDRFKPPTKKITRTNENLTVWTTNFPNLLKLTDKEKQTNPNAMVAYKRPQTLSTLLTNYKIIAHKVNVERGISQPCGNCMLCDRGGKDGMTIKTDHIKLKTGNIIKLKKHLNCKNFGIYAAQCNECEEYYVGQTITSFSKRWCSHRHNWKNMVTNEINDKAALKLHYTKKHPTSNKVFKKAFSITFIDTTKNHSELDFLESKWINKLQATININKTILPFYR